MSRPRGERTGDENPASMTIFADPLDRCIAAGLEQAAGPRVEWDQIHLGEDAGDQPNQLVRVAAVSFTPSLLTLLERDAPRALGTGIAAAGGDQFGDGIFAD